MKDKQLFISSSIFFVLFLLFIAIIFTPARNVFSPFVTTLALVYFLSPAVKLFKRIKINAVISILIIYALITAVAVFAVMFAIPKLYDAVRDIGDILIGYMNRLGIESISTNVFSGSMDKVYTTVVSAVKGVLAIVVGAVAAFYILTGIDDVKTALAEFIPLKLKPSVKILLDDVKVSFDAFFKGQILIAAILFLIDTVFLYVMGIPYALGLGFIAAILDIVPYAGAFVAIGIILLVTLASAPQKIIIILIGLLLIQQVENNIITPKISSDTLSLHPSITVLVLYLGAFGGFWSILLAIPLTCIFRKICQRFIQSII